MGSVCKRKGTGSGGDKRQAAAAATRSRGEGAQYSRLAGLVTQAEPRGGTMPPAK